MNPFDGRPQIPSGAGYLGITKARLATYVAYDGCIVTCTGGSNPGDGGGGTFAWREWSAADVDGAEILGDQTLPRGRWVHVSPKSVAAGLSTDLESVADATTTFVQAGSESVGSGGGGLWVADPDDVDTPDNGGTVRVTATGRRMKRLVSAERHVIAPDFRKTTDADDTASILRALEWALRNGASGCYQTVRLPGIGRPYLISDALAISVSGDTSCHLTIAGDGAATVIEQTDTGKDIWRFEGDTQNLRSLTIRDMKLIEGQYGIKTRNLQYCWFSKILMDRQRAAAVYQWGPGVGTVIYDGLIVYQQRGYSVHGESTVLTFRNCVFGEMAGAFYGSGNCDFELDNCTVFGAKDRATVPAPYSDTNAIFKLHSGSSLRLTGGRVANADGCNTVIEAVRTKDILIMGTRFDLSSSVQRFVEQRFLQANKQTAVVDVRATIRSEYAGSFEPYRVTENPADFEYPVVNRNVRFAGLIEHAAGASVSWDSRLMDEAYDADVTGTITREAAT